MNKRSDNFIAEMLFKTVGAKVVGGTATWEKASRAVRSFFRSVDETLGGEPIFGDGSYTFQNGSGLYDVNRLSPHQLARVLRYAAGHPEWGSDFAASLPIAGRDGTLKRRMRKGAAAHRARGKTGSLNGVDALAGIVSDKDGTAWIYVFLANDVKAPHREVRRAMDGLVETIAGHQAGR